MGRPTLTAGIFLAVTVLVEDFDIPKSTGRTVLLYLAEVVQKRGLRATTEIGDKWQMRGCPVRDCVG
jgi:hypothetical protein